MASGGSDRLVGWYWQGPDQSGLEKASRGPDGNRLVLLPGKSLQMDSAADIGCNNAVRGFSGQGGQGGGAQCIGHCWMRQHGGSAGAATTCYRFQGDDFDTRKSQEKAFQIFGAAQNIA